MMDPYKIIDAHYPPEAQATKMLIAHSIQVRDKALEIASRLCDLNPDEEFISEAAMLHDIGIYQTAASSIGCTGHLPYICHGVAGRDLLDQHGLPRHALVCERHVGVGITITDIQEHKLPLPLRDMQPVSLEERIICYADKFFSKKSGFKTHGMDDILAELARYGDEKVRQFKRWREQFEPPASQQTVRQCINSHPG